MKFKTLLLTGLFGTGLAAQGALISLDVNGYNGSSGTQQGRDGNIRDFSGEGVLGGGIWTTTTVSGGGTQTFSSLQESDGTATSVQVEVTNITNGYALNDQPDGFGEDLMRDYVYIDHGGGATTSTITISGLDTMTGYESGQTIFDIVIYSSNRYTDPANDAATWTLGGTSKTSGLTDVTSLTEFTEGVDYVRFYGIADSGGTISGTWTQAGSFVASTFNGIQITFVPEPSSTALLGLGLSSLLLRRKRS